MTSAALNNTQHPQAPTGQRTFPRPVGQDHTHGMSIPAFLSLLAPGSRRMGWAWTGMLLYKGPAGTKSTNSFSLGKFAPSFALPRLVPIIPNDLCWSSRFWDGDSWSCLNYLFDFLKKLFLLPAFPPILTAPVESWWQLLGMLHTSMANIPAEGRKWQLCKEGLAGWPVSYTSLNCSGSPQTQRCLQTSQGKARQRKFWEYCKEEYYCSPFTRNSHFSSFPSANRLKGSWVTTEKLPLPFRCARNDLRLGSGLCYSASLLAKGARVPQAMLNFQPRKGKRRWEWRANSALGGWTPLILDRNKWG